MSVVIVSFTFPPYGGIGGRRWAKFSKYLFREGLDLRVIAAKRDLNTQSDWTGDIKEYSGRIEYLEDFYPKILSRLPKNIFEKLQYKLALQFVKLICRKGNYYDPSLFFNRRAKKRVEQLIQAGARKVIITCAPFRTAYELLKLKMQYPKVEFLIDFRDPWVNNKSHYGLYNMPIRRQVQEAEMEKNAIATADKVFSVSDEMNDYFKGLIKNQPEKYYTVPNGFDPEDFQPPVLSHKRGLLKLAFTGNFYAHCKDLLLEFVAVLKNIQLKTEFEHINIEINFFGTVPDYFERAVVDIQKIIKYQGKISLQRVYQEISASDACLLFLTDDLTYSRSTKFYEYIGNKKPIIIFSNGGGTGEYVEKNGIGYHCKKGSIEQDFIRILNTFGKSGFNFNTEYHIEQFNVKQISKNIYGQLIQNTHE